VRRRMSAGVKAYVLQGAASRRMAHPVAFEMTSAGFYAYRAQRARVALRR